MALARGAIDVVPRFRVQLRFDRVWNAFPADIILMTTGRSHFAGQNVRIRDMFKTYYTGSGWQDILHRFWCGLRWYNWCWCGALGSGGRIHRARGRGKFSIFRWCIRIRTPKQVVHARPHVTWHIGIEMTCLVAQPFVLEQAKQSQIQRWTIERWPWATSSNRILYLFTRDCIVGCQEVAGHDQVNLVAHENINNAIVSQYLSKVTIFPAVGSTLEYPSRTPRRSKFCLVNDIMLELEVGNYSLKLKADILYWWLLAVQSSDQYALSHLNSP